MLAGVVLDQMHLNYLGRSTNLLHDPPGGGPTQTTMYRAAPVAWAHPGMNPTGANDFGCRPTNGRSPVVLIPGTNSDAYSAWSMYSPRLRALGYCVFSPNFSGRLSLAQNFAYTGDIRDSAKGLKMFVEHVMSATGAPRVTLVGWSQGGGPLPNYYLTKLGGDHEVDRLIALAPSNHGVGERAVQTWMHDAMSEDGHHTVEDLATDMRVASYEQQLGSSDFMHDLYDNGPVTRPGVGYTLIEGKVDWVVAPYTNAFLDEPGVRNINVQDVCPSDLASHVNFTYDENVFHLVVNALDPDHAKPVHCVLQPFLG